MLGCIFYKISVFVDKCIGKYLSSITSGTGKFWGGVRIQHPENIYIGEGSFINPGGIIYASKSAKIIIGKNCMISYNVHLRTDYHRYLDSAVPMKQQGMLEKDIRIEDDVWIGCGAQIMSGVTIGTGAVVGAGAVVCHDVPCYAVVAGVPARIIKNRIDSSAGLIEKKLEERKMVNVIGLGYIGLPTALMMASHGVEVIGTDYNKELVATLNAGKTTFKEKGLDELFQNALAAGVKFTTEYQVTDTYIVSVPTPYDKFSKKVDACYVVEAVKDVMRVCPKGSTVVVESTVSPGTIDKYVRPVIEANGFKIGEDINLVHAPERIIPGNMVYELLHNNRTIGADDKAIGEKVKELYSSFCQGEIVVTDIRTAEMTKVVENTFRAVNIAFANELAKICRHDNMDVYEIIKICNMHPRVNILQPGPGVGGHCISVDPWFLVGDYPSLAKVIDESMKTNDGMPDFVLNRIYEIMKEKGLTDVSRVGLYGLTYKENVDDMRESPTLQLLESQERHLATGLKVYDPFITKDVVKNQYHDLDAFLADVDMVVVMVKHTEIRENVDKLAGKVVLDCHNIINLPGVYHI